MMLLGWTTEQFALAKSYYDRTSGDAVSEDLDGARKVLFWWEGHREDQPGNVLVGIEAPKDLPWAMRTMVNSASS